MPLLQFDEYQGVKFLIGQINNIFFLGALAWYILISLNPFFSLTLGIRSLIVGPDKSMPSYAHIHRLPKPLRHCLYTRKLYR
jgi:hypothetical protein